MQTLHTPHDIFKIAQLSDLHLSDTISIDKFLQVLKLACADAPDLLLLTGDLVNDGRTAMYDWLFETLTQTKIPFVCLAGNHDVTIELGHDLPFEERQFLPTMADNRLMDCHRLCIEMPDTKWQILSVNSAVNGQIYGRLSTEQLDFLVEHLQNHLPTIIAMHHHSHLVGSAWIDAHILQNHQQLWQALTPFDNLKAVICGHVHQAHHLCVGTHSLYTCPATSRQFLPHHDDFAIDDVAAGFRLIHICNKKTLETWVKRVQN